MMSWQNKKSRKKKKRQGIMGKKGKKNVHKKTKSKKLISIEDTKNSIVKFSMCFEFNVDNKTKL